MAKVSNGVETLLKILMAWVGRTNVTDRQTTDRQTGDDIANVNKEVQLNSGSHSESGLRIRKRSVFTLSGCSSLVVL